MKKTYNHLFTKGHQLCASLTLSVQCYLQPLTEWDQMEPSQKGGKAKKYIWVILADRTGSEPEELKWSSSNICDALSPWGHLSWHTWPNIIQRGWDLRPVVLFYGRDEFNECSAKPKKDRERSVIQFSRWENEKWKIEFSFQKLFITLHKWHFEVVFQYSQVLNEIDN